MPKRFLRRTRHAWLSPTRWLRRIVFWVGALAVGVTAVLFALGSEQANQGFRYLIGVSPWLPLLITPAGFVAIAYVTRRFFPGSQGSGIPQTIAALEIRDHALRTRVLSLRIAISKVFLTMLALLCGASVGREGPTVQVGASILHATGAWGRFSRLEAERALIIAGGAAGVAAAFNTPLAGIVFAIEEMSRSLEQRISGMVLTAVIMAGAISLAILGNYTYFGRTTASFSFSTAWLVPIVCGVMGGVLGGLFSRVLILLSRGWPGALGQAMRAHPLATAAICGLLLALVGLASGNTVYGTGYHEAKAILEGHGDAALDYGVFKMLATVLSYASGIPGGIFAPSLAVGAGFGADLTHWFPLVAPSVVVVLAMVAYFAGVVQAPITAFVIVMEMTDKHDMIIPLMVAALVAHAVSKLVCPTPLYRSLAARFLPRHAKPA